MLSALLLVAIGLSLVSIGLQLRSHRRWERWAAARELELRKLWLAHRRVAKLADKLKLRVPRPRAQPIPLVRPARTWEDEYDTRNMDAGETFLPVDFRHDLW